MKWLQQILVLWLATMILTGCWNRSELPQKGFILGAAIDQIKPDKIKLAVQIYKPGQKAGVQGGKQAEPYVNIETKSESVFDAVRDITLHLGRKAQWSHIRVIIIDDETAGKTPLLSLLDEFYRDHETRMSTKVVISQGNASKYLEIKPLIEQTVTHQMNRMQEIGLRESGKVPAVNLLQLAQALKSQVPDTVLPYAIERKGGVILPGAAMIKDGKMIGTLTGSQTENILMLTNQFKHGALRLPCEPSGNNTKPKVEAVETHTIRTKITPVLNPDKLKVNVKVLIIGNISELKCSRLDKPEDEIHFQQRLKEEMEKKLMETIRVTQEQQIDLIGLGNSLYRNHTKVWKEWKKTWRERYAEADFEIEVTADITHTLTTVGKPVSAK
ncbi:MULTISPECIES: Ger(x)C family spore germination protein [unclassified Paenibacillus]|uniref:Ger(x)C family spore germination protein n=1 Tax=unclassified Paenibacillus TaxID=185978 RepID=UPI0010F3D87A|nr:MULTISPECIES: Ger(x)C family spore germination protein [unclassified Paenibacillus]NIK69340.1 spore germination protein KC [Paenibacillus sp. BK720]TCM92703.1 spore germination protein KC [Paenibacillus sp. BK033]